MSQIVSEEVVVKAMGEAIRGPYSGRHGDILPYIIHKVGAPPKQTFFQEIKHTVKDVFFSGNPLSKFKDQTLSRKFVLCLEAVFPIFDWGRGYNLKTFRCDFIAGITIASLCIPQVTSNF